MSDKEFFYKICSTDWFNLFSMYQRFVSLISIKNCWDKMKAGESTMCRTSLLNDQPVQLTE